MLTLVKSAAVACLLALSVTPALAVPTIYSGYDIGAGSLASSPNATTAQSGFLSATNSSVITFESALPAGVTITGGSITNNSGGSANLYGYNTTPGGGNFLSMYGNQATFGFANPISYFGAYFTGWQISSETLNYFDGSSITLLMPAGDLSQGGTVFYGFIDPGAQITSVTYNAAYDITAVDDILYGSDAAPVPEPSTVFLLGVGLFGLGIFGRKARKS